ncbi:hypothetical protein BU16DRAFT_621267 [Lophium mytilinum]|uniref:Uncharacterized protein n=1 Tax=Lophium mytilinum TaxID=390894 RepID=A0A6A6QHS1_9PEZI|nr:hypothetical protein BU16DRAFT_621267 [Lophium mytilinum]
MSELSISRNGSYPTDWGLAILYFPASIGMIRAYIYNQLARTFYIVSFIWILRANNFHWTTFLWVFQASLFMAVFISEMLWLLLAVALLFSSKSTLTTPNSVYLIHTRTIARYPVNRISSLKGRLEMLLVFFLCLVLIGIRVFHGFPLAFSISFTSFAFCELLRSSIFAVRKFIQRIFAKPATTAQAPTPTTVTNDDALAATKGNQGTFPLQSFKDIGDTFALFCLALSIVQSFIWLYKLDRDYLQPFYTSPDKHYPVLDVVERAYDLPVFHFFDHLGAIIFFAIIAFLAYRHVEGNPWQPYLQAQERPRELDERGLVDPLRQQYEDFKLSRSLAAQKRRNVYRYPKTDFRDEPWYEYHGV